MAEVLPSSPHYATAEVGGGRYMREDRSNSNSNRNRSSSSGEKISVSVRGRRDSGGGVSAVLNICKGETSGDDDDEDEDISQERRDEVSNNRNNGEEQPWILAVLLTTFRRSLVACKPNRGVEDRANMDISWPTNVRHVAHVTFDRFNGFLGLPVEFEMEIPRRAPSASASVFGVSAESMQLSYDSRGNSVPTILLLMQQRLYAQGGLKAEGIFRINAENSQEENVRDQLNKGIVPDDIDMHCLAGLIKAWFRELPSGVLDSLTPEQVLQCNDEKQCVELVQLLPPTQSALLNWAINLMTDVVQEELHNKMNARNIAMVFAPNMTQMADPLTALMHAVQVMNLLKTLILKTLREREESALGQWNSYCSDSNDDNDYGSTPQRYEISDAKDTADEDDHTIESPEYLMSGYCHSTDGDSANYSEEGFSTGIGEKDISDDEEDISRDSMFDRYYGSQFAYVEAKENKEIDRPRQSISYDIRKESRNFDRYSSRTALDKARGSFSVQMPDRATIYQFRKDSSMVALEGDQNKTSTSEQEIDFISVDTDEKNITYHIEDEKENSKEQSQHLVQMIQSAVKTKGRVVNTIDQQTERVEAW